MAEYTVTWKVVIQADDAAEARRLHTESLEALDEAPCSVWVWGDGPKLSNATMSASSGEVDQ